MKNLYITPLDIQVLFLLYENEKLTPTQIYEKLNKKVTLRSVLYSLKKLNGLELVDKEKNGKESYYYLADFRVKIINGTAILRTKHKFLVINCPFSATCEEECSPNCPFFLKYREVLQDLINDV